jgi:hypothetical protein
MLGEIKTTLIFANTQAQNSKSCNIKMIRRDSKEDIENSSQYIRRPRRMSVPNPSGEVGVFQTEPTDTLL